jgi:hypothetical protein
MSVSMTYETLTKPKPSPYEQNTYRDIVDKPAHYNQGTIEVIDYILDQQLPYTLGNAIKYISRCRFKGSEKRDLEKAIWYLNKYKETIKDE